MMKKYMMNMAAIEGNDTMKFEFLTEVFEKRNIHWTRNNIPVVDMTTGKIYETIGLDYMSGNAFYAQLRKAIRDSIELNTGLRSYVRSGLLHEMDDMDYDYSGEYIHGHYFMDCGSIDVHVLKAMYEGYKHRKEEKIKEESKKQKEKEAEENRIEKFMKASAELDKAIEKCKELLK